MLCDYKSLMCSKKLCLYQDSGSIRNYTVYFNDGGDSVLWLT